VGVHVAGRVGGGGGQVAGGDLVGDLGLDLRVVDGGGGNRGRDRVLAAEGPAADALVGAAAEVGVVLGEPVEIDAVGHAAVEGGDAGRGGAGDLRVVASAAPDHLHHLDVGDHPAAVVGEVRAGRHRGADRRGRVVPGQLVHVSAEDDVVFLR